MTYDLEIRGMIYKNRWTTLLYIEKKDKIHKMGSN